MLRHKDKAKKDPRPGGRVLGMVKKVVPAMRLLRGSDPTTDATHATRELCPPADVRARDVYVSRDDGSCLRLLVLSLEGESRMATGVLWIHGGGYVTGIPEIAYAGLPPHMLRERPCVVVCPDYRLASEMPFPGGLEDCHLALAWLSGHAEELGVCSDQLVVGGEGAGGGLATALCLYERDLLCAKKDGVQVACQMPLWPMLDDRPTSLLLDDQDLAWDDSFNMRAWDLYLSGMDRDRVVPYAVPARETSYAGMPPAITFVGSADPYLKQTVAYVNALRRDGVPTDFRVYRGRFSTLGIPEDSVFAREARSFVLRHFADVCDSYVT